MASTLKAGDQMEVDACTSKGSSGLFGQLAGDIDADKQKGPLPPLQVTSAEEAEKISALIEDALGPLLDEARSARQLRESNERINLYYQTKLSEFMNSGSGAAKQTREKSHEEEVRKLGAEIDKLREQDERKKATIEALGEENTSLRERVSERDATIASDGLELAKLRGEALSAQQLRGVEKERDSLRESVRRETERRESLNEVHKAATRALHSQVATLTGELSSARAESSALRAAQQVSARDVEKRAREMEEREVEFVGERRRMEQVVERMSKELEDTKAAAKQLDESFKTEVEHLEKMCELHEGRVKEAEARAADCEEALKQERDLSDRRVKKLEGLLSVHKSYGQTDLAPHVHTLLKDMEKALEARWALLENQKAEVERARQIEVHAVAERERLERELKDIRAKADIARRDALRYSEQVDDQAQQITTLQKQLAESQQAMQQQMEQLKSSLHTPTPSRNCDGRRRSSLGWSAQKQPNTPLDIGPQSIIPFDYFASPSSNIPHQPTGEFSMSLREMSEIRKRHERVLESLRDNRVSLG